MLVTIDLDAYDQLQPRQLRAMLRALRFADGGGLVRATLAQLAMPGLSRSAVHRDLAELERAGGYYLIPAHFADKRITNSPKADELSASGIDPVCSKRIPADGTSPVSHEPAVPEVGTTDSRAPAFKVFSSGSKEPSERALSQETIQENLSDGWREAAAAERRRAGLVEVDLEAEWRKYVRHYEGRARLGRWLNWAARAWLDHTNKPQVDNPPIFPLSSPISPIIPPRGSGSDQERVRAGSWVRTGRWAPQGIDWGPPPDQPGCALPARLVAWCRDNRAGAC